MALESSGPMFDHILFGGDYNPEQWPRAVWDDDVRLMSQANVTTATIAVFGWAQLEPQPGEFDFSWLDEVFEVLHAGGIRIILGTSTASPPAWMAALYPDTLPVDERGVRLGFGSRQQVNPSSAQFRFFATRLVERLAERYGKHPALEAWHIGNEYGCHVARSYDDETNQAFRVWLAERYESVDELNRAWGTTFWSQRYGAFDEVSVPRIAPTTINPGQFVDFDRFSSDALLELYRDEARVLRRMSPTVPLTTNFMSFFPDADYWRWAREVDFVSDDSYPMPNDPDSHVAAAAARDLMRSLAAGKPWVVMEQATSAVNWSPPNAPKAPGQNRALSMQAVARGADGILYFQWRQSVAGAESFHSAMVPHAGESSRVFREVVQLGAELATIGTGDSVMADVAILFDWDSWRVHRRHNTPIDLDYRQHVLDWYRPLLQSGVTVDFASTSTELAPYRVVIVPALICASVALLERLNEFVKGGGALVVGFQSAILDEDLHVYRDGYLGPLREALGLSIEEFAPVALGGDGTIPVVSTIGEMPGSASVWQEIVRPTTAMVLAKFADGFAEGSPALTRNTFGDGVAWYIATHPDDDYMQRILTHALSDAGVVGRIATPTAGVEVVQRGDRTYVINHSATATSVVLDGETVRLESWEVAVRTDEPR